MKQKSHNLNFYVVSLSEVDFFKSSYHRCCL